MAARPRQPDSEATRLCHDIKLMSVSTRDSAAPWNISAPWRRGPGLGHGSSPLHRDFGVAVKPLSRSKTGKRGKREKLATSKPLVSKMRTVPEDGQDLHQDLPPGLQMILAYPASTQISVRDFWEILF